MSATFVSKNLNLLYIWLQGEYGWTHTIFSEFYSTTAI